MKDTRYPWEGETDYYSVNVKGQEITIRSVDSGKKTRIRFDVPAAEALVKCLEAAILLARRNGNGDG